MKNILLIIALLFSLSFSAKSSVIDKRVMNFRDQNKIDTFIVYSILCIGVPFSSDSCEYEKPSYLIWKKSDNYFLKKFDCLNNYPNIQLDSINPLTFYLKNKKKIEKENIKPPSYYEIKKIKGKIDTSLIFGATSHSCFHTFSFLSKGKLEEKRVDAYNIGFKKFDDGHKNIYYNYNEKTKLQYLITLTLKLIKQLETENKFITEKIE